MIYRFYITCVDYYYFSTPFALEIVSFVAPLRPVTFLFNFLASMLNAAFSVICLLSTGVLYVGLSMETPVS